MLARATLVVAALMTITPVIVHAVLVAPHAVFMDHQHRTAQITLANPGNEPEEVQVDLQFGYPSTDSTGNPYIRLLDSATTDYPSAAGWVRAFPRRLTLQPGQRQVVRLLATPPADLADGEHWSRIIVTSRREAPLATLGDSGIHAGLTLELRTIISLTYRKGDAHTSVALTRFDGTVERDTLVTWVGLERDGNAAYLGSLKFRVADASGATVRDWSVPVAVYYGFNRRIPLPLDGLAPGAYRLSLEVTTAREDIPQANVLPAAAITRTLEFRIE